MLEAVEFLEPKGMTMRAERADDGACCLRLLNRGDVDLVEHD
jgi:hypothetical protein